MSKRRLVITAVLAGASQSEVARTYGVSQGWISKLMTRYRLEGETAFEPRSRRPKTSPGATPPAVVELVISLRHALVIAGLDAGPETIAWHLTHNHQTTLSRATIARILTRSGLVIAEPRKKPKAALHRFEADLPNECWQADFTHYPLADGTESEILCWIDDATRYAISVTAHPRVSTPIVTTSFRKAVTQHGIPASTLTDNGMVFTTRFASHPGRNGFEAELRRLHVTQKNGRGSHPQTQGKVERFQQTLKKWLRAQPDQPTTITALQSLLDEFVDLYNHQRGHRSLPHRATPATRYETLPKALPANSRDADTQARVRHDRIDKTGCVTLRVNGQLKHIGIGRTHAQTHVILLVCDLEVRVINATTGELLRELTINPDRDYQPKNQ